MVLIGRQRRCLIQPSSAKLAWDRWKRECTCDRQYSSGFTLLEVVLAIALSATLFALIASALSLFLTRTNDGRQRVEQAQLARNLMRLMGDDLRNIALYTPQDTSIAAQLAKSAGSFDVDAISGGGSGSGTGGGTGSGTGGGTGSGTGSGSGSGGGSGGGSSGSSDSSSSESSSSTTSAQLQQPLGVYGNLNELQIDILQPARPLPAPLDQTAPLSADEQQGALWRGGLRTIRYYCREGERPRSEVIVAERFGNEENNLYGGLVREDIDRLQYDFAQQSGSASDFTQLGQVLAPEVLAVEFRYSNGTQILEEWNSEQQQMLPVAIEVRIWLRDPTSELPGEERVSTAERNDATQYVMSIPIWRSALASGSVSGLNSSSSSSGSDSTSGSGSTSGSSSGGGSSGGGSVTSGGSSNL